MSRIRKIRKRKGWTQAELSRRSKISYATISRFEADIASPSFRLKRRLARTLKTDVESLFPTHKNRKDKRTQANPEDQIIEFQKKDQARQIQASVRPEEKRRKKR